MKFLKFGFNKQGKKTPDLRPVTSRALTSIFDTLRPYLDGATLLDLYGGTGRFTLSALKEGAAMVNYVEVSRALASSFSDQVSKDQVSVYAMDVFKFLHLAKTQGRVFDIIFADPPFRNWQGDFQARLFEAVLGLLSPKGIFLVRSPKKVLASSKIEGFQLWKTSIFGDSELIYLHAKGLPERNEPK